MKLMFIISLLAVSLPSFAENFEDYRTLHVSGKHTVSAMPDLAVISVKAYGEHKESNQSKKIADQQLRSIIAIAKKFDVGKKHINTSAMRLQPRYSYHKKHDRELESYETSYNITIKLKALNMLGELLHELSENNISRINNIQYVLENDANVKDQALSGAMRHAKKKALILTNEANVVLGKPLKIHEYPQQSYEPKPRMMRSMIMDSAQVENAVAPPMGELDISAHVTVIYELDD